MTKGGGNGKTPGRVVELLKDAVAKKGQSAVARESGLTQSAVHRYLSGLGEPSTATLQKLADYFVVTAAFLRGDSGFDIESAQEHLSAILTSVTTLSKKTGRHEEFHKIIHATSELSRMLLPLITERDGKIVIVIDQLKEMENNLDRIIDDVEQQ